MDRRKFLKLAATAALWAKIPYLPEQPGVTVKTIDLAVDIKCIPVQVTSAQQAAELFGQGSPFSLAMADIFEQNIDNRLISMQSITYL